MEGALDCGSADERGLEILRPMFTCRPRPSTVAYCGGNSNVLPDSEVESRSCFSTRNSFSSEETLSKANYGFNSKASELDSSLNSVEEDNSHLDQKPRTSRTLCPDNSSAMQINGTVTSSVSHSLKEKIDCCKVNCKDCHFNIDNDNVGLIGQLNGKLRLGQSFDKDSSVFSEQLGLATKAISRLNGCRPKYPSLLGELPNLCLSKQNHDLEAQVPFKETKPAKCTSDCASSGCQPFAQCSPESWYSDAVMSNGINGFLGLNSVNTGTDCECYRLNCQSQVCQTRVRRADETEATTFTLNHLLSSSLNLSAPFQTSSSLDSVSYVGYESEIQMPDIMRLIQKDLSEPYSVYTYRYFIHNWPHLCYLALIEDECVGAIVCKLDMHKKNIRRGYIAMLAVDEKYRKKRIGSNLVLKAIQAMIADDADEVVLETEITNKPALQLYENLGFVRDKRLFRYYLNGVDALRLKLWLR